MTPLVVEDKTNNSHSLQALQPLLTTFKFHFNPVSQGLIKNSHPSFLKIAKRKSSDLIPMFRNIPIPIKTPKSSYQKTRIKPRINTAHPPLQQLYLISQRPIFRLNYLLHNQLIGLRKLIHKRGKLIRIHN